MLEFKRELICTDFKCVKHIRNGYNLFKINFSYLHIVKLRMDGFSTLPMIQNTQNRYKSTDKTQSRSSRNKNQLKSVEIRAKS